MKLSGISCSLLSCLWSWFCGDPLRTTKGKWHTMPWRITMPTRPRNDNKEAYVYPGFIKESLNNVNRDPEDSALWKKSIEWMNVIFIFEFHHYQICSMRLLVSELGQTKYFNSNASARFSIQSQRQIRKINYFRLHSPKYTKPSQVVVVQRTATKCTTIYNARALNLLFGDVPVFAVAVVVCRLKLSNLVERLFLCHMWLLVPFLGLVLRRRFTCSFGLGKG